VSTPGTVTATHSFSAPGVYMVLLDVNDSCGGVGTSNTVDGLTAMVVVYDPNGINVLSNSAAASNDQKKRKHLSHTKY